MLSIFTKLADWFVYSLLNLNEQTKLSNAIHFFVEDTSKILVLLIVMIYFIAFIRSSLNVNLVKTYLENKSKLVGYILASFFGAVTPFCSCSSIPLFLGFTSAGIPTGVTLSFLITSPLLNEVAIVLLGSLLGWKFTITYIFMGLLTGIMGGILFDIIGANKMLQPMAQNLKKVIPSQKSNNKLSIKDRHLFAKTEALEIFTRIWKWVILGVGIGAGLHGFIPETWVSENLGVNSWWSVPIAVLMGIPLYSNATGMIPIVETLLEKGLSIGTVLAFMLSTVGASFPEFVMLKQVLKPKLLIYLFGYFLVSFSIIGWIINFMFKTL